MSLENNSHDPGSQKEAINFYRVDKVYPPNQIALKNIDFKILRGEFVFIAGASGAGKSTLLKMLFAQEVATRGQVIIEGRNIAAIGRNSIAALRRSIGVIFQDYKLLANRTVLDNAAFTLEVMGVGKRERQQQAFKLLNALGLKEKINSFPPFLSGGEQQRVSIARALINRPKLILADEPTGNLDPDMTVAVFNLLIEANACGATVIIATHNLGIIEEINKRTIVLDKGKLIGDFTNPRN